MSHRQASTAAPPEHERKSARWLSTPLIVMIVLVVLVLAIAFAIVRPWNTGGDEAGRSATPVATAMP